MFKKYQAIFRKYFIDFPYQYRYQSVPNSDKFFKKNYPMLYFYLSLRPLMNTIRHLKTDVFLVSYPKCGRTWLRALLGKYIADKFSVDTDDYKAIKKVAKGVTGIPNFLVKHEDQPQFKKAEELNPTKYEFADKKVIFLARDPRDVIVSHFYQLKNVMDNYDRTLSEHVRKDIAGINTIIEYLNIWNNNRDIPRKFHLIRYEDMKDDINKEFNELLKFLEINVERRVLEESIEYCQFQKMRNREKHEKNPKRKNILKLGKEKSVVIEMNFPKKILNT